MSTPNFKNNGSTIYAFGMSHPFTEDDVEMGNCTKEEFENGEHDYLFAEMDMEDTPLNVLYELKPMGYYKNDGWVGDNERILCSKDVSFEMYKHDVEVTIDLTISSGYYEGAQFLAQITRKVDGWEIRKNDEDVPQRINNKINKVVSELLAECEKVLRNYCELYICDEIFSNGEAIYHKVE